MSMVPPRYVPPKETVTLRLETAVHQRLKEYADHIHSPKEHVVAYLLTRLFKSDKKFKAWLREHTTPEADAKSTDATTRRGRA